MHAMFYAPPARNEVEILFFLKLEEHLENVSKVSEYGLPLALKLYVFVPRSHKQIFVIKEASEYCMKIIAVYV